MITERTDPIPLTFAQAAKVQEIASYFTIVRVLRESRTETTAAPIYVEERGERGFARVSGTGGLIHIRALEDGDYDQYDGAAALATADRMIQEAASGTLAVTREQADLIMDYDSGAISYVLRARGAPPVAPIWIVETEGRHCRIEPNGESIYVPPVVGDYDRYTEAAAFAAAEETAEDA